MCSRYISKIINFLKNYIFMISFFLLIGLSITIIYLYFTKAITLDDMHAIKSGASLFLVAGVIYAARQFHLNQTNLKNTNRWNKRQLAMVESNKANDTISEIIEFLNKEINYTENQETYKVKYLHDKFGKFGESEKDFEFGKNGQELKVKIVTLLNTAEYIATGVNTGILDEDIVKRLWKGKLNYAFRKFENYIVHLRKEHNWGNSVYIEMETLFKKWKEEEKI